MNRVHVRKKLILIHFLKGQIAWWLDADSFFSFFSIGVGCGHKSEGKNHAVSSYCRGILSVYVVVQIWLVFDIILKGVFHVSMFQLGSLQLLGAIVILIFIYSVRIDLPTMRTYV
jgi:hypothetical protein